MREPRADIVVLVLGGTSTWYYIVVLEYQEHTMLQYYIFHVPLQIYTYINDKATGRV